MTYKDKYSAKYAFLGVSDNGHNSFDFGNFTSPIFDEIKDPAELAFTFNRFPIIPFFGTREESSDSILALNYRLSEITPVFGGCIESIVDQFMLGAGFELRKREGIGIVSRTPKPTLDNEFDEWEERLSQELVNTDIDEIARKTATTYQIDGNIFLKLTVSKITKTFQIQALNTTQARYLEPELFKNYKEVLLSSSFRSDAILSQEPESVPVYPNYIDSDGLIETIIHVKRVVPNRDYYGLSKSFSSMMNSYLLNQLIVYLSAETDNRFTGKVMIDAESSSQDSEDGLSQGTKRFLQHMKNVYTNKGTKKASVLPRFREKGSAAATVTQFQANTSENFYKTVMELVSQQVIMSFSWDKRLVGYSRENGLGGNDLDAIFRLSSLKVKSAQAAVMKAINTALFAADDFLGLKYYGKYDLQLGSLYQKMISENQSTKSNKE